MANHHEGLNPFYADEPQDAIIHLATRTADEKRIFKQRKPESALMLEK